MKKKTFLMILVGFCLCIPVLNGKAMSASASISNWFSDSNMVGRWCQPPSTSRKTLGNDNNFRDVYQAAFFSARSAWNNAGLQTTVAGLTESANIQSYGGTYSEIQAYTGDAVPEGHTGLTYMSYYVSYNVSYNGVNKTVCKMVPTEKVYIINLNRSYVEYVKTCMHELGHSLGWFGHASDPAKDVMWGGPSTVTTLSYKDKKQLTQMLTINCKKDSPLPEVLLSRKQM